MLDGLVGIKTKMKGCGQEISLPAETSGKAAQRLYSIESDWKWVTSEVTALSIVQSHWQLRLRDNPDDVQLVTR